MKYIQMRTGKNVYLSPMNVGDAEAYIGWLNDPRVSEGLGRVGLGAITLEDEKKWIQEQAGSYQFSIVRLSDHRLLGNCGFNSINQKNQNGEVGLFIGDEAERGKGYGAEALDLLVEYGFNEINLNNIMLTVFSFNQQAITCYKKVGFHEFGRRHQADYIRGEWQDKVYMEILRKDWCANKLRT